MNKKTIFIVLALLSLSLVSAHSTYYDFDDDYTYKEKIVENKYFPKEHITYSKTTYIDYDNDKRYPTDDYKYGYCYRTTVDYRDRYYSKKKYSGAYYSVTERYGRDSKDYYYEYVPYLRGYQKKECYTAAPKNKLFYIRCP